MLLLTIQRRDELLENNFGTATFTTRERRVVQSCFGQSEGVPKHRACQLLGGHTVLVIP